MKDKKELVEKLSHTLKGVRGNMGLNLLCKYFTKLESMPDNSNELLNLIEIELQNL